MAKADRERLHLLLLERCPNVYFQPPSTVKLVYPCIIYSKTGTDTESANNQVYNMHTIYQLTVIEKDADGDLSDTLLKSFSLITVNTAYVMNNLYHTFLTLYY